MRLQQLLYNITRRQVMEEDSDLLSGGHNVTRYTGSVTEMKNPGVFFVLCFISVVTFLGNLLVLTAYTSNPQIRDVRNVHGKKI